ncbi:MAG: tetratricopeptide repeat protein, partial [Cyclobacteriaceae bacterium]
MRLIKTLILIYGLVVIVTHSSYSRQHIDSAKLSALYDKGVALEAAKRYQEAMVYYRQVSKASLELNDWDFYIKSQNSLSWMHYQSGQYDSARDLLVKLLITAKGKGNLDNSHIKLGMAYSRLDEHTKAIEVYKDGMPTCTPDDEKCKYDFSDYFNQLSIEYWYLSQYDSVLYYQEKNTAILKTLAVHDYTRVANSIGNMGLAYWKMGQLHLAEEYLSESQRHLKLSGQDENVGISYTNLGGIHVELRNFRIAIGYFRKALTYLDKDKYHAGILYHNISACYTRMEQYDSARYYINLALRDKTDHFGENHSALVSTYTSLGTILTRTKQYKKAEHHYKKALTIGKEYLAPNDPGLIESYNLFSQHYVDRVRYPEALQYADTALAINSLNYSHPDDHGLSSRKSKREFLQSLSIKAGIYTQRDQVKQAVATYESIIHYYDSIIYTANFNTEKHFYKEGSRKTSEALMRLYARTDEEINHRLSFDLSEKNKSTILRLSLDETTLKNSIADIEVTTI